MAEKLSARQKAQLAILETLPPKFVLMHRLIEELAGMRADDNVTRRLLRILDETKATTNTVGLHALTDTLGIMGTMARRTGGQQMKIRGLREGLGSLKTNFEGALRSASTEERDESGGLKPT